MKDSDLELAYKELYNQIAKISLIGQKITTCLNFDDIMSALDEHLPKLLPTDIFALALADHEQKVLTWHSKIAHGERLPNFELKTSDPSSNGVLSFKDDRELVILDQSTESESHQSAIFIPLRYHQRVVGVISVQSKLKNAYTPLHVDSMSALASYVAIALENTRLFERVAYLAMVDELTQVLNRRALFDRASEYLKRAKRYGLDFSLVILDLDHFKEVNDKRGHQTGDLVLKNLAQKILGLLRDTDVMGRYGGEEFMILLPDTTSQGAHLLASRIRSEVEAMTFKDSHDLAFSCTLSIGIASNRTGPDLDTIIQQADEALYFAKSNGRNQVSIFSP